MKKKRNYLKIFIFSTLGVLFALIIDNIFWISASPEWLDPAHTVVNTIGSWTGAVYDYTFGQLIHYVFGYRVFTVISNWRDLTSALIFGGIVTLLVFLYRKGKEKLK